RVRISQDAVEEQLDLDFERVAQILVEGRVQLRVRVDGGEAAKTEPLEREVGDQGLRPGIGQHALDLSGVDLRVAEGALLRKLEQLVVRPAAPQEERQARRELDVVDRIDVPRLEIRARLRLDPIEELRAREDGHQPLLDARLEPAGLAARAVKRQQRLEVGVRDGPPECAARELRQNLLRARQLLRRRLRVAAEY